MPKLQLVLELEHKTCPACSKLKLISEFRAGHNTCKECRKVHQKAYYARPEVVKHLQDYKERTKERRSAHHREYANRPKVAEILRAKRLEIPWERRTVRAIRNRCLKNGIAFDLTEDDIRVPDYCPVLGIRLKVGEGKWQDSSPSVDRIDPMGGYVRGNIAVISWRANRIKCDGSVVELDQIVSWMRSVGAP